jgi:hypothetical protein
MSTISSAPTTTERPRRGLLRRVLDFFSSITLGITLLALLFIYSGIGSAGLPLGPGALQYPFILRGDAWVSVREMPFFEMTEFEWFHWWPFDLLILLLCVNLVVTTIRRIPFTVINLGVWMIHAGIVILCIGSVIYFGTKIEGDAPVIRRQVVIQVGDDQPVSIPAIPGARASVGIGPSRYDLMVSEIDPAWEILSGEHEGLKAYSVNVRVASPTQQFTRQLLAGYPQYTEDVIRSDDPAQPFQRAIKATGKPLVDETLTLSLLHAPQTRMYLMSSAALYLREVGTTEWIQRPIRTGPWTLVDHLKGMAAAVGMEVEAPQPPLPRYSDHVPHPDSVWPGESIAARPFEIAVPATDPRDPLKDHPILLTGYLRYAEVQERRTPGPEGSALDPAIGVRLTTSAGLSNTYDLLAFDPTAGEADPRVVQFHWITSAEQGDALAATKPSMLEIHVPGSNVEKSLDVNDLRCGEGAEPALRPIEGTPYSCCVESVEHDLMIGGRPVSVAIVRIRVGERTFTRWVFDDPSMNTDLPEGENMPGHESTPLDEAIQMTYRPGRQPPLVLLLAGPGEDELHAVITTALGQTRHSLMAGQIVPIGAREDGSPPAATLEVIRFASHTTVESRPAIIPTHQRDPDFGAQLSMVHAEWPANALAAGAASAEWLPFHHYAFTGPNENLRRYAYRPTVLSLASGEQVEVMFSRERIDLPAAVVLDDFVVTSHVGGFAPDGNTASIRDWTSVLRFETDAQAGTWSDRLNVSTNDPKEFAGLWYFQSQWDPPMRARGAGDVASAGLNYTVLGVANRHGVHVQLAGCCLAVIGMIYAFYVKPMLKRRRQQQVHAQVAAARAEGRNVKAATKPAPEPVGAAWKETT